MAISDRIAVMKDGVIRHCGEPQNIYQRPADLFVATFIGKSNLLNAKLMQKGREAVLEFPNGYRICMDSVQDSEIRERDVTLSVRPEELFVHKCIEGERKEGISAKIMDSVFLGSNTHYFVELETGETAEIIQEETGAMPLLLHSCHNVTRKQFDEGVTYLQLMRQNVENLRYGLE